jgi:hypothetical protein
LFWAVDETDKGGMMRVGSCAALVLLSVVLFGGMSRVYGEADVVRVGQSVVVASGERVNDAIAVGGSVRVEGEVTGDVVAVGGSVFLQRGAVVRGTVTVVGGLLTRETGTTVQGDITEVGLPWLSRGAGPLIAGVGAGLLMVIGVVIAMAFVVVALLLVLLLPGVFTALGSTLEKQPWQPLVWGVVGMIMIVPVAGLLLISVLGIPLIPLEFLFVGVAMVVGAIAVALTVGKRLLKHINMGRGRMVLELLTGLGALWVLGLVPGLGWMVKAVVMLWGFGLVLMQLWRMRTVSARRAHGQSSGASPSQSEGSGEPPQ